ALELSSQNIFPKSEREFYGTWNKIWGFGMYKAVVESAYGSQGGVATATASVFMLPVKLILLILIASLILFVIFLLIKKRKESSQAAKLGSDLETRHEESDTPQKEN